ncbi:TRAP transporter substrate-binding protein [Melioribacteraceae bacterium 4301-Me]|uniref:TRAP transporter substrate-binding protein n=1 Tax=Pyranulibacter aquaticus TaxID=3163344 RepID=UPI00359A7DF5
MKIERREFLKKASIAAVGGTALIYGCGEKKGEAPAVISNKKFEWKMVTAWPPHFPLLGDGAEELAKWIFEMSNGRLKIQVYGGGELVPPLEAFDAVSSGVAEMGHGASYYWAGKSTAAQFFTNIPFGMNTIQTNAWLTEGGGLDLWRKLYEPFNLMPFPVGNTGAQMGGWFNKQINSLSDIKGLKMRIPGLAGNVFTKAGGTAILSAGGEIYTNLERGVIDATDWIGPYHDYLMGLHKIAKYYYYPTWSEPTGVIELIINKKAYEQLPSDLQNIIRIAAYAQNTTMLSKFEALNAEYYKKLKDEEKVQFKKFPDDVISAFRKYSKEVIDEITSKDSMSKKIYDSYISFQKKIAPWFDLAEINYNV